MMTWSPLRASSRGCVVEAELVEHLGEIDDRKIYLVFERDGGRCTFVDEKGNRCPETGMLEFDHLDGFARTHLHHRERIVLRCHAHNQHAAERMYGRAFHGTSAHPKGSVGSFRNE